MSQFVYLYRGAERARSPDKMQEMMQKWMTWMKQLTDKGHIKDPGQPLEHTQASQRQAEDSDRRAVCRDQGHCRRLHADRSP